MKKYLLILLLVCLLSGCAYGNTDYVSLEPGDSELYSREEIFEAMEKVQAQFGKGFGGCVMLKLWYDEKASLEEAAEWAEQYGAREAMILYSDFWVDGSGRSPSLNPGSLYRNWMWILVRDGEGWEVRDWGY